LLTLSSSQFDPFQTWLAGQGQRADVTPLKFREHVSGTPLHAAEFYSMTETQL